MTARGLFVLFEGLDRTGKSTQADLLAKSLTDCGAKVQQLRFPDRSTTIGEHLDKYLNGGEGLDPHAIHLLFSANRWEWNERMQRLLASGTHVVCDRYAFSGAVYSHAALKFDWSWCMKPDEGLLAPDLIIQLVADPKVILERSDSNAAERYETETIQNLVQKSFEELRHMLRSDAVWFQLDANQSVESIHSEVNKLVQRYLPCQCPVAKLWDWRTHEGSQQSQ